MIVSPSGVFEDEPAKQWVDRVSVELKAGRRVSLPGLGTLGVRDVGGKRVVELTQAPELVQRMAELPDGDVKLNPSPAWVSELPNLHGAIADALADERTEGVNVEGFGLFAMIYANPDLVEGDSPEHIPFGSHRWVRFKAAKELLLTA